jgi:hypothetical protein
MERHPRLCPNGRLSRRAAMIGVAALVATPARAAPIRDLAGWGATRWGMKPAELPAPSACH